MKYQSFIPDLNIWFTWHAKRGTLPKELKGMLLNQVCGLLGVPLWKPIRPWTRNTGKVVIEENKTSSQRIVRYILGDSIFTAKWTVGPDGDLWQTEYPVKTTEDLRLFRTLVEEEEVVPEPGGLAVYANDIAEGNPTAVELPLRPFARLMMEMLGFSEGLYILMEAEEQVRDILLRAEEKYKSAIEGIVESIRGTEVVRYAYSPDNLDASFVSPSFFEAYMLHGYKSAASILHSAGFQLIVHAGGPVGNLLELIKTSGIDCIAGICGPPQGDTAFPAARDKVGKNMVLWGGVAQDILMPSTKESDFENALTKTREESDSLCIFGIADHVPIEASWERLKNCAAFFAT